MESGPKGARGPWSSKKSVKIGESTACGLYLNMRLGEIMPEFMSILARTKSIPLGSPVLPGSARLPRSLEVSLPLSTSAHAPWRFSTTLPKMVTGLPPPVRICKTRALACAAIELGSMTKKYVPAESYCDRTASLSPIHADNEPWLRCLTPNTK